MAVDSLRNTLLSNVTFYNNSASSEDINVLARGGGVYGTDSDIHIQHGVFQLNHVQQGYGGATALANCRATLQSIKYFQNEAAHGGGLNAEQESDVTLRNTLFTWNIAVTLDLSGSGGAIRLIESTLRLDDIVPDYLTNISALRYNRANFGGAIATRDAHVHSQVAGARLMLEFNDATRTGGGILAQVSSTSAVSQLRDMMIQSFTCIALVAMSWL